MNTKITKLACLAAAGISTFILGTGCQSSKTSDRSGAQREYDQQVAHNVKKSLSEDPTYKFSDVRASVYDGSVQLSGFVETPEQRQRAADCAAGATGTRQVVNDIMIKPTPTGPVPIRDLGQRMLYTNSPTGAETSGSQTNKP